MQVTAWLWRALGRSEGPVPARGDTTWARVLEAWREVQDGDAPLSDREIEAELRMPASGSRLLLGRCAPEGVAGVLRRFGVFERLHRLGYRDLRVTIDPQPALGDRVRLHGDARGETHLLAEAIVEASRLDGARVLFVHWLTLRHPASRVSPRRRAPYPGQDVPGTALAREAGQALALLAMRCGLDGVAFHPAHYHVAFLARRYFRFRDPGRQRRFEALVRTCAGLRLHAASRAIDSGAVLLDGRAYTWEPDPMVLWVRRLPRRARMAQSSLSV